MLFAHLAPANVIARIKRNGLRQGGGRRGRGLYCVPLFEIPRKTYLGDPCADEPPPVATSAPRTSLTLWKGLFRYTQRKNDRPIAVVFRAPASAWPADLYVDLEARMAEPVLRGVAAIPGDHVQLADEQRAYIEEAARKGYMSTMVLQIREPVALGLVLRQLVGADAAAWNRWDESIEIIFRTPIPARCIERLVPLDRTNRAAREARDREPI